MHKFALKAVIFSVFIACALLSVEAFGQASISSVSPGSGSVGSAVVIVGAGFGATQGTSTVTFNGTAATPTIWSATSITAPVPNGASSGNIIVTVGGQSSNGVLFTVLPTPQVTSLSPSAAVVGGSVTITGANFGTTQGTSTVTFNGVSASPTTWSATSITVSVPAGATSGSVVVTVGTVSSEGVAFNVIPSISGLSPTSGSIGTSVTIAGASFGSTQTTSTVTFSGVVARPSSWSTSSITASVPSGAVTGNVIVTVAGQSSNGVNFTVTPAAPSITSLSPSAGSVGSPVTINGANFGSTQGASTVTFNGTTATPTSWSATSVAVTVPPGASTGNVIVTVGGQASNGSAFTVTVPAPTITSLSPTGGPTGTSVNITGTNFGTTQGSSTVTFNGTAATPSSWNPTSITVPVPVGATSGNVVVKVNGQASNGMSFTVLSTSWPTINAITPSTGVTGTAVTISGSNFGASQGTSTVTFNGITASPSSWSATTIAAPVPAAASVGNVVVTVNGQASNATPFGVIPHITGVNPASGPSGSPVQINGSGFGPIQGSSNVTFNGVVPLRLSSWSDTQIVAEPPPTATTGPVVVTVSGLTSNGMNFTVTSTGALAGTVTNATTKAVISGASVSVYVGGNAVASTSSGSDGTYTISGLSAGTYTVIASASGFAPQNFGQVLVNSGGTTTQNIALGAPSITALSPSSGPVGTPVQIVGSHFGSSQGGGSVTFNGTIATPSSWGDAIIKVAVPSSATTGPVIVRAGGASSNAATFTVGTGIISGTVTAVSNGAAVSGASVQALQSDVVKGSAVTSSSGIYSIANLSPGTYDVKTTATGYGDAITSGNAVSAGSTTTLSVALPASGTISGKITQSDGTTAIVGATARAFQGSTTAGTVTTDSTGAYTISGLGPGAYSVQASNPGYMAQIQTGVAVTAGNTTTQNFSLATQGVINYVYDESGRLVGVSSSTGNAAIYSYDAAGNVTSISQNPSTTVSISNFDPLRGPVGTTVYIYGTGFSPNANQNTVTFNGATATVTSSSATQIVATVPAGATTGAVSVTAPAGSATSSASFTVTSSNGLPTITSFTPTIAAPGTSVTIQGTNFDTKPANDLLAVNLTNTYVSTATAGTLTSTIPGVVSSGHLRVSTAVGSALSSAYLFVPPPPYTVAQVGYTGQVQSGGSTTVPFNSPNQIGLVVVELSDGQGLSINTTSTFTGNVPYTIYDPYGQNLGSGSIIHGSSSISAAHRVSATGTCTIVLAPGNATGSVTLSPTAIPADISVPISVDGQPVTVTTTAAGQNAYLTFTGNTGQRLYLYMKTTSGTTGSAPVGILAPNGATVWSGTAQMPVGWNWYTGVLMLPQNGTYTIYLQPTGTSTFGESFQLATVPPDLNGTITVDGSPITITTTATGQNGYLTFSGTQGQRLYTLLTTTSGTASSAAVGITNPDSSTFWSGTAQMPVGWNWYTGLLTLNQTGTYTIYLKPSGMGTFGESFQLVTVPPDLTGTITVDGQPVTQTTTASGQRAYLTFNGAAGQRLYLYMSTTSGTASSGGVGITNPDGSTFWSGTAQMPVGWHWYTGLLTLPENGTYTIYLTPNGQGTFGESFQLVTVPADLTGSIFVDGSPVVQTTTANGQRAYLTFGASQGQRFYLSLKTTSGTAASAGVGILNPDGSSFWSGTAQMPVGWTWYTGLLTAQENGIYTLYLTPNGMGTFGESFQLVTVPPDITGQIVVGGGPVTLQTIANGQRGYLTFSGTANQTIVMTVTSNSGTAANAGVGIINPNGSYLITNTASPAPWNWNTGNITLPQTGTYKVYLTPNGVGTFDATFSIAP